MAVKEFKNRFRGDGRENDAFESFVSIVNEYIKDKSPSEVNIDSRAKSYILKFNARETFVRLDSVRVFVSHDAPLQFGLAGGAPHA